MRTAEIIYLEDVLGVEGYIRPVGRAVAATAAKMVVAFSEAPLINGRLELLKKMLASIQVYDFIALDCNRDDHAKLANIQPTAVVYLGGNAEQLAQSWPWAEKLSVTRTVLPSLEQLTDTSDMVKLQIIKKQAWSSLQSFQKEI